MRDQILKKRLQFWYFKFRIKSRIKYSLMLHHVAWYLAADISEQLFTSTLIDKQSKNLDS